MSNLNESRTVTPGMSYANYKFTKEDWVKTSEKDGVIYECVKTPFNQKCTVKVALQNVKNAFTNSNAIASKDVPDKSGRSLLVQVQDVIRINDPDRGTQVDYPLSLHFVVKAPNMGDLTEEILGQELLAVNKALSNPATQISNIMELLRGDYTAIFKEAA